MDLLDDPRFRDSLARRENAQTLIGVLDEVFRQKDWAEWQPRLEEHGIPFGLINRPEDVPSDRTFEDAGAIVPVAYDDGPVDRTIGTPVFMRGQDKVPPQPPPGVGEHNTEVLRELGYDDAEIASMEAAGVLQKRETR
jgi:formyl-CoA transferase